MPESVTMEQISDLCSRRGIIFHSSSIYNGLNGFFTYGPLGAQIKKNIRDLWWKRCVEDNDVIVGMEGSIIDHPSVWKTSGHMDRFADKKIDCKLCKARFRTDELVVVKSFNPKPNEKPFFDLIKVDPKDRKATLEVIVEHIDKKYGKQFSYVYTSADRTDDFIGFPGFEELCCPCCDKRQLVAPRNFNLMLQTDVGYLQDEEQIAYLRPETAQGIFVNFKNIIDTYRLKIPFGIAQIGKCFRNEIAPRHFTYRSREFEIMEIEFFCHPSESDEGFRYWIRDQYGWLVQIGIKRNHIHERDRRKDELAHYSLGTCDLEYDFPFGRSELECISHRGDFDLRSHMKATGVDLSYFDEHAWENKKGELGYSSFKEYRESRKQYTNPGFPFSFIPHVIEPSIDLDRLLLALLCEAYDEDEVSGNKRTVLRLDQRIAPIKAAVFPLQKSPDILVAAEKIHRSLNKLVKCQYDDSGSIGKRYRRQDEIGTPLCITVDPQYVQDGTVTIRDRDSCNQERIPASGVEKYILDLVRDREF